MSSGVWELGEAKERAGLYNKFISLANSRISSVKKGVVGIPIKADWGTVDSGDHVMNLLFVVMIQRLYQILV